MRTKDAEKIASKHLLCGTLKVQNRDRLDFHDCHVMNIKAALDEAYKKGQQSVKAKL